MNSSRTVLAYVQLKDKIQILLEPYEIQMLKIICCKHKKQNKTTDITNVGCTKMPAEKQF